MKNLKVKILIGIPASGKSTWSLNYIRNNPDWTRVSRDDFRFMLKNAPVCEPKIEALVSELVDNTILSSLKKGLNVIIDNTNLKASYINDFIELVKYHASVEFQIFDISVEKALDRDKDREKSVGEKVIKDMYKNYKILMDSFDFSNRPQKSKVYKNPTLTKERVILCDIDGTLAHMNGKRGPFEWDKVDRDDVDEIIAERLRKHKQLGEKVIIVTGRDASCRKLTEDWLEFYNIPYHEMFMRKKNDFRKDNIIKKEIYDNFIEPNYSVEFVYDDRNQVVNEWRSMGIKVFQVEEGNF